MVAGLAKTIPNSFEVVNTGGVGALVEGAFAAELDGTHGLISDLPSVIPAENFYVNGVPLNNNGARVFLDPVLFEETMLYETALYVPTGQSHAAYSGTLELTFTPDDC